MKYTTLIIANILIFCSFFLDAQTISKQINWLENYHVKDSLDDYYILQFENSVILSDNNLPFISENINISDSYEPNADYNVKLNNIRFIAIEDRHLKGVKNLEQVSEEFLIQSKLLLARGIPYLKIDILPIRKNKNSNLYEKILTLDIIIEKKYTRSDKKKRFYANNSVLSNGTWK